MDKDIIHPRKKGYEGNTEIVRAQVTEEMLATLRKLSHTQSIEQERFVSIAELIRFSIKNTYYKSKDAG